MSSMVPATPPGKGEEVPDAKLALEDEHGLPTPPDSAAPSPAARCGSAETSEDDDEKLVRQNLEPEQRVSIYVQVFEEMVRTVMERESYLFNDEEKDLLDRADIRRSDAARYLFVRLFSRKNGWFRSSQLKYHDEIADMQGTVDELCKCAKHPTEEHVEALPQPAREATPDPGPSYVVIPSSPAVPRSDSADPILIDDDDEEDSKTTDPLSDRTLLEIKKEQQDYGLTRFAINETILAERADIDELLKLLSLDELKALAKDLKIGNGKTTRAAIIEAVKRTASSQSTLTSMFAASAAKAEAKKQALRARKGKARMTPAPDVKAVVAKQTEMVIKKILAHLGPCIKLESAPIRLFARLHLIYYRSVQYSEKTLTQAVLSRFKKRAYPTYEVKRSFAIFESREALIEYEEALILERRMEECLGEALDPSMRGRKFTKEDRENGLREGLRIFEAAYPRWQAYVADAKAKDAQAMRLVEDDLGNLVEPPDDRLTYYRKRFLAGWPLTRVVHKGTTILARLHQYEREVDILRELLEQSCFRRGRRGEWYDRLALVLMNHFPEDKEAHRREALEICQKALPHPWTHLIYHNSLQRRIVRLESALGVPEDERHAPVARLRAAKKRVMKGEKLSEGETGKKSIWRGHDGAEVSVEELALQQYAREGWKGFHSENGILTTLFALLFWDVIFLPVDGVFETAYQAAPLDLSTDAFAIVRYEQVQDRLRVIRDGGARRLLEETDDRERPNKTYCVGVKWTYEREDLVEIVQGLRTSFGQCLSPKALASICRVYAEEWSHRVGGVPDLFLWNFEERTCRFVEVKGPGDILSETQKVWIDVLLSADVSVELCSVQQMFEEDELSLSETERKRLSPLRKRASSKRKSCSAEPAPSRRVKAEQHSETDDSDCSTSDRLKRRASLTKSKSKASKVKARSSSGSGVKKRRRCSVETVETIVLSD